MSENNQDTILYIAIGLLLVLLIFYFVLSHYNYKIDLYSILILYIIIIFLVAAYFGNPNMNDPYATKPSYTTYTSASLTAEEPVDYSNLDPEDYEIGGLKHEFEQIMQGTMQTRCLPKDIIKKAGIQHTKGVILYGPPGTGKTTLIRQFGKIIKARSIKIVKGPEIFDKWVGNSEKNIRELFTDAKNDYMKNGDKAGLYVICIDEMDSIMAVRGSGNSSGVDDKVVNQFLTEMDGIEQCDNFIVFGTTNRLDMLDTGILRRFELKVKINRPDYDARVNILQVLTKKKVDAGIWDTKISYQEIAKKTPYYTGSDLNNMLKIATSTAVARFNKEKSVFKITMADINEGLNQIKPKLDPDEEVKGKVNEQKMLEMFSKMMGSKNNASEEKEEMNSVSSVMSQDSTLPELTVMG